MNIAVVIPPYAEPVSLAEMKNHLKVETSVTDDDALITSQIAAARDVIETFTGENVARNQVLVATTFDMKLDRFPYGNYSTSPGGMIPPGFGSIVVPKIPLISVTAITYVDSAGVVQTVDPALYVLEPTRGGIDLAYNQFWPYPRFQPNAVTIRFTAGMAAPFTADATGDALTVQGRTLTVGDRVRVLNSGGTLPAPLAALTDYFVLAGGKLSLTSGGASIDITSAGSGTPFISSDLASFETGRAAIKLLVGFWYENRAAVDTGRQAVGATVLPMAVESLVAAIHA